MWLKYQFLVIVVSVVLCQENEEHLQNDGVVEGWQALTLRKDPLDTQGWQPADIPITSDQPPESEIPVPRRRLYRRRKRPLLIYTQSEVDENPTKERLPGHQTIQKPRLDEQNSHWHDEMLSEEPFRPMRPHKRRRLYPKYEEIQENIEQSTLQPIEVKNDTRPQKLLDEKGPVRVKLTQRLKDPTTALNEDTKRTSSAPIDLRAILKKYGNFSLSELLQQKNLSLSDLLKGGPEAISAFTATSSNIETTTETFKAIRNRSTEHKTEEKRVFVPPHPKLYTSVNYKPLITQVNTTSAVNEIPVTTEVITSTTKIIEVTSTTTVKPTSTTTTKPRPKGTLPPTHAKLRNSFNKLGTRAHAPIKIDVKELLNTVLSTTTEATTQNVVQIEVNVQGNNTIAAKQEIMEVLNDSTSKLNLTKILESRNMSLNELIELRERGSSQRHLADIFHNSTKEPEPNEVISVDQIVRDENIKAEIPVLSPNLFEEYNKKLIPVNWEDPNYIMNKLSSNRESRQNQISIKYIDDTNTQNGEATTKTNDIEDIFPFWKEITLNKLQNKVTHREDDFDLIENFDTEDEFVHFSTGVRSAVIASAIIIGISLMIFFTIFIIFKWSQKSKKQMAYNNAFIGNKIRSPILESHYQRRIFNTLLNATLGRRKKISTISSSEPQSIQDYLWDNNDKRPFQ